MHSIDLTMGLLSTVPILSASPVPVLAASPAPSVAWCLQQTKLVIPPYTWHFIWPMIAGFVVMFIFAFCRVVMEWLRVQIVSDESVQRVEELKDEYRTWRGHASEESRAVLDLLLEIPSAKFTWGQFATLDGALIDLVPINALRRSVWWWRLRYQQAVSPEIYSAYLNSGPPDPVTCSDEDLRADVGIVVSAVHQTDIGFAAKALSELLTSYLLGISVYITLCLLILPTVGFPIDDSIVVLFAGWTGGVFSSQQRLLADQLADLRRSKLVSRLFQSAVLSPASGAVFAVILYLFFVAGLLKGAFFPQVYIPTDAGASFSALIRCTAPTDVGELAKLIIWSFIAGFLERLVPDKIDALVGKTTEPKNTDTPK